MGLPLSTPGSCCGHNLNHHTKESGAEGAECLICSCDSYVPDRCYYGHVAGCEHLVDSKLRCQARLTRLAIPEPVQCIEEFHHAPGVYGGLHRAYHPTDPGTMLSWSEQEAVYPVANPDRVIVTEPTMTDAPEEGNHPPNDAAPSARDEQVGGNHYRKFKIQPWDVWQEYGLDAFTGAILKYLLRDKGNRLEDLRKARHTLDRLIEIEEAKSELLREEAEEAW